MNNDSLKRRESPNETSDLTILKSGGTAARSVEKKSQRLSGDNRAFFKDLAVMAIISAIVLTALIIFESLK